MSVARSSYLKNTTGGAFVDQTQGGTVLGQELALKDSATSKDFSLKQNSSTAKIVSGGEFGRMRRGKYIIKGATDEIAALQSFILSFLGRFADVFKNLSSRDTIAIIVIPDAPPPVCRFTIRVGSVANPELLFLWFPQNMSYSQTGTVATDDDYDFVIDWGNGSDPKTVKSLADFDTGYYGQSSLNAPYTQTGDYNVTITGKFDKGTLTCFQPHQNRINILSIEEWGGLKVDSYFNSFIFAGFYAPVNHLIKEAWGSSDSVFTNLPAEAPVIETDRFDQMFGKFTNFNSPINNWDVSAVTSLQGTFKDAHSFNQPLDNWNTSSVTTMSTTFHTDTGGGGTIPFDQDISNWDFSSLTGTGCLTYFGSGLSLSPANYDALLAKWQSQAQSIPENLTLVDMGTSRYTSSGAAARLDLVANYGWTITDGGQV